MADGGGEGAKGNAKNGGGMWFRVDVPCPGANSVAHFGKPGPDREFGFGYPGVSFWTSSDFTSKAHQKHFLESHSETIIVAGSDATLVSRATVDVIGTVGVDIGTPGTLWVSAVKSAAGAKYQTLSDGGDPVPTDKGHLDYVTHRQVLYKQIEGYKNWAAAIDASVDAAKAFMGFSPMSWFPFIASVVEIGGKAADAAVKVKTALEPSPSIGASNENAKVDKAPAPDAGHEPDGIKGFLLDVKHGADTAAAWGTSGPAKWGKEMSKAIGGVSPDGLKKVLGNVNKVFLAVEGVAKLYKAGKEILGFAEKKDPAGSVFVVAEQNQTVAIGKKQVTIAGEGVEVWVPSIKDSFQVVAGGGITMKSGLKTEGFSIQAMSLESMLGSTLAAGGPVQVMSRLKTTEVLGKEINIGANAPEVTTRSAKISSAWVKSWNPARQQPTKLARFEVAGGGEILVHVDDDKRELSMDDKKIKYNYEPSKSSITMDAEGITIKTDKKLKFAAQEIVLNAKSKTSSDAKKSLEMKVKRTSFTLGTSEASAKRAEGGTHQITHKGGKTEVT